MSETDRVLPGAFEEEEGLPAVDPLAAQRALEEVPDVQLIDVREPIEHQMAHIAGCRLIPMGEIPARYAEIDRSRPAIVVCRSGGRSARVVQYLRAVGYDNVYNLAGGMEAWIEASLPIER